MSTFDVICRVSSKDMYSWQFFGDLRKHLYGRIELQNVYLVYSIRSVVKKRVSRITF